MRIGPSAFPSDYALRQVLWIDATTPEFGGIIILRLIVGDYNASAAENESSLLHMSYLQHLGGRSSSFQTQNRDPRKIGHKYHRTKRLYLLSFEQHLWICYSYRWSVG